MTAAAPRIDTRLVTALRALDDPTLPIAETNRRLGQVAEYLGLARPSYEQVRMLVHDLRTNRALLPPDVRPIARVLMDIAFRVRPPEALLRVLAGSEP